MLEETVKGARQHKEYEEDVLKGMFSDLQSGLLKEFVALNDSTRADMLKDIDTRLTEIRNDIPPAGMKVMGLDSADEPKEVDKAIQFKATKEAWEEGFGDQLVAISKSNANSGIDSRLTAIHKAATGLGEQVPSDGGFLVQTDFSNNFLQRLNKTGLLLPRTQNIPISTTANGIKINGIDEASRVNGSRWGGVRGFWLDEAGYLTASKPKFRQIELNLKKLGVSVYATEEMLADAAALGTIVSNGAVEELNFKIDDALFNGDGAGKPQGIMNSKAQVTVAAENGQLGGTVVAENIFNMWSRMYSRSRGNAVWNINQDIEPQLFGMSIAVGTGGIPVYLPAGGLSASPFGSLFGRPVIPLEQCATLGTTGDITLNDWSQYITAQKGGVRSASSVHVRFLNDEMVFKFIMRLDGQVAWHSPLAPFKGSKTQSPFVALATRA